MKLVSVLMPAYNVDQYIDQAIRSIVNQTYGNWELIICNDGSTDSTYSKLQEYKDERIRVINLEENLGNLKVVNRLLKEAKGDYITLQDADDWSDPTRLAKQVEVLESSNDIHAVGTQCYNVGIDGSIKSLTRYPSAHSAIKAALPQAYEFVSASVMIKRHVYEEIGGFHPFFDRKGGADWYWLGMITLKYTLVNLNEGLYYYRYNPNSITNNRPNNYWNFIAGDLVVFLLSQQIKFGTNGLEKVGGEFEDSFNSEVSRLKEPFLKDHNLLDRMYCIRLIQKDFYLKGTVGLINNLIANPYRFIRWIFIKVF